MENVELTENEIRDMFLVPYWVTDKKTALKFALHLQYRLHQSNKMRRYLEKIVSLTEDQNEEYSKIRIAFDKAYNEEK